MSHNLLILRGLGSQYVAMYTLYLGFTKFKSYFIYLYVSKILLYALSYVKEKISNILTLDIDDQNTVFVFASRGS